VIASRIKGAMRRLREVGIMPMKPDPAEEAAADPLSRTWHDPDGFYGWLTTVQNGPVVNRYLAAAFALFCLSGLETLVMRWQLARPDNNAITPQHYNELFTMHGSIMMFLVTVPIMEAFASFALPVLLGARELPFPRMTAFGFWTFLFGAMLLYSSRVFSAVPAVGWTAYAPLSLTQYSPGLAVDFWLLGLSVAEVAALGAGIELIIATLKLRAPGMTLSRMPIVVWSILVPAYAMLFGFTPLLVGTTLLELDRKLGMRFFDATAGGDPLLWQHLFWIFGHPDVYIQFIPATGIISLVVAAYARRPLAGHTLIVAGMIAIGIISFGLWVHHMFSAGLSVLGMSVFAAASMAIAIPSGIQVAAWIVTLWKGRVYMTTSLLFALGFIVTFVVGGVTGVMVAAIPFDWQVHDTYFVVGHFHYVLVGGVIFPIFAGFYYWLPKMVGRMLDEGLGRWHFWLMFVGFQLAFFPMHISGLLGMPRRVYTYPAGLGWELPNMISSAGAYILGLGVILFIYNVYRSVILGRGVRPNDNPWQAGTLDWATETPPPDEGYRIIPVIRSRYPLWEQRALNGDAPEHADAERIVQGLAQSPTAWRAQLVTSVLTAEPQAIVRLSGPSIWPLLAAIALTLNFVATLFDLYWLLALSSVGTVVSVIAWLWPSKEERERRLVKDADAPLPDGPRPDSGPDDIGTLHGLPVYTSGTSAPGWWTMIHVILIIGVSTACLVMSYLFLGMGAVAWPPAEYPPPTILLPTLTAAALLAGGLTMRWAEARIRAGAQGHLRLGLAVATALCLLALGLLVTDLLRSGISPSRHAYESAVATLLGYEAALLVGGLIILGVVQVQAWLGYFDARRFLAIQNVMNYYAATAANWVVVMFVVHLSPYVY